MIRDWRLGLLCWFLLSILLSLVSYWVQQGNYAGQISAALKHQLPERIHEVFSDVYMESQPEALFIKQVNRDLSGLRPGQSQCSIRMVSMNHPIAAEAPWPSSEQLNIPWQLGDKTYLSSFLVTCHYHWLRLLTTAAGLSLLVVFLLILMPSPVSATRSAWMKTLIEHGDSLSQSYRLTAGVDELDEPQHRLLTQLLDQPALTTEQALGVLEAMKGFTDKDVQWFLLGLQQTDDSDAALTIARTGEQLAFETATCVVKIHGVDIKLPKTPFLYYLWYAELRKRDEDDGWHTNPSSQRPDTEGAEALIELMSELGGHQKAIKELQQNGLRAKTLDQNRNKIKDELQTVLGEELAKSYLFDSTREPKSGRSRYRLALSKELIELPAKKPTN